MFQDDGPEKVNSDVPGDMADNVPVAQETVQVIPGSKLLWRINSRPPNSAQVSVTPLWGQACMLQAIPICIFPVRPTTLLLCSCM